MVKDYFQDIVPPSDDADSSRPHEIPIHTDFDGGGARGIRNIQPPTRSRPPVRMSPPYDNGDYRQPRRFSGWWIWIVAGLSLVFLCIAVLLAFRQTTVSVIPKSQVVTLNDSIFVAHKASTDANLGSSRLSYTLKTFDIEDSEVVPSQGTRHVENKASGSIIVYNEHSTASVRLIKNTRFESPDGLIFRVPADIVIPGKSASAPGQVKVSIIADKAGEAYNIGPVTRFTLPGLKSGEMYSKVYARSTSPMLGGFAGDEPGTAPGALNSAIAAVRGRLETKARADALTQTESAESADTLVFPGLIQISFRSQPNTTEAGSGVRIHEKAHVEIPVFHVDTISFAIAESANANASAGAVSLKIRDTLSARMTISTSTFNNIDPITFVLNGEAELVWKVDEEALTKALLGRESSAFQTIVNGFAGIKEAHARIEPLWKKTFPSKATSINIEILPTKNK